jgi:23S rRNA (pseudouridine1915-N3)-methyltransferase
MKIVLLSVGKTSNDYVKAEFVGYVKRLSHYIDFESIETPNIKNSKNLSKIELKRKEGEYITKVLLSNDYIILLDENGININSIDFSKKIEKYMLNSYKRIVFVIGGAFGFSNEIYHLYNEKLSLSKMTFSHQMVRLFFIEQLYRSFTIINNEKYHHK